MDIARPLGAPSRTSINVIIWYATFIFQSLCGTYHVPFVGAGSVAGTLMIVNLFAHLASVAPLRHKRSDTVNQSLIYLRFQLFDQLANIFSPLIVDPMSTIDPMFSWSFSPHEFSTGQHLLFFFHGTSKVAVLLAIRERLTSRWAASDASAEYSHTERCCMVS